MKCNFKNAEFDYSPYPICYIPHFFDDATYKALNDSYPDKNLFAFMGKHEHVKYSLAEAYNPDAYHDFVEKNPDWNRFYSYIKSQAFIEEILAFLKNQNIDLGLKNIWYVKDGRVSKYKKALATLLGRQIMTSKFEFSMLPADTGRVIPHTDSVNKIITLVVSFIKDGEWKQEWGGGVAVNTTKDARKNFNHVNKIVPFEEVETVKTFPFQPNQCVLFIKTYNSLHSVAPLTGPEGALRKTVTISIKSFS